MYSLMYLYKKLIENVCEWSYYFNAPHLTVDTLLSSDRSFNFIKEYFKCGGKAEVFNVHHIMKHEEIKERSPHIISTYLLGILIAKCFGIDLHTCDCNRINFKYIWFLACLYHDIGYVYENMYDCRYLRMIQTDGLDAIQEICNIKYLHETEFITYKKEYINTYLRNRSMCANGKMGKIDHGITGGLLLYDRLRNNFEQAWKKAYCCDHNISRESFEYNGLRFSNTHYKYYAQAADAIIAHNIWIDSLNEYLLKDGKTILGKYRIGHNNQVAFILSLADTLEPIKRMGFNSLDRIFFEEKNNGFTFSMASDIYKCIYDNITNLQTWVDVNILEERNQGRFSIMVKE